MVGKSGVVRRHARRVVELGLHIMNLRWTCTQSAIGNRWLCKDGRASIPVISWSHGSRACVAPRHPHALVPLPLVVVQSDGVDTVRKSQIMGGTPGSVSR